jgi:hypothetical protein
MENKRTLTDSNCSTDNAIISLMPIIGQSHYSSVLVYTAQLDSKQLVPDFLMLARPKYADFNITF